MFGWGSAFLPTPKKPSQNIEVTLLDAQQAPRIVRDTQIPDSEKINKSDDPLRFLSAETQSVKKQMVAANSGMTQNRSNNTDQSQTKLGSQNQSKNSAQKKFEQKTDQSDLNPADKSDDRSVSESQDDGQILIPGKNAKKAKTKFQKFTELEKTLLDSSRGRFSESGVSTLGEEMPRDMQIGSFTALNTDRYLFYSFYARIEQLIRYNWESMVRNTIDRTNPLVFSANTRGRWTTVLEIWIQPDGKFHSHHLMKSSGLDGFDKAATQSFVMAKMFPNPPAEMIDADGMIKVQYAFTVYPTPKAFVGNQ
jgi:TonB family protein